MTPPSNDKWKCPSPDKIELNTKYTCTFNPDDSHQYFGAEDRHIKFHNWVRNYFINALSCESLTLHVEISGGSRLHVHGVISWKTKKQVREFFLYDIHVLRKKFTYEIDTIKDNKEWMTYCTKQNSLLELEPITKGKLNKKAVELKQHAKLANFMDMIQPSKMKDYDPEIYETKDWDKM